MESVGMYAPKKMTNAQAMLLELLNVDLSEQELNELRRVVAKHLRDKLDREADETLARRGLTTEQLEQEMAFTNRTERLEAIRKQKNAA